ncbi:exodeoxyribonuclease III [Arsenicicoccus sp. oral taxon 190]|uniref:exodeoxyribonuclease III n=1 Tax=Arsenicicoccus sp. oral taxon 190 TaxID=1658671 RepID=UPI00067A1211|nr:exodeoxyribonuclease III [Arsenicicoccus sp. oral taxon 190]AKT50370.1 exodeoxyribonuclease III [Arsenicicoccus sp. oral taxon 190]
MRIATWNVNSIRSRVDRVVAFLDRHDVDVLALQETKCTDAQFPMLPFEQAGYEVAHHGLNQWNGVAVASRVGLTDVQVGFDQMPTYGEPEAIAEARALGATCDGVRVWSLYVPNGRELGHTHYAYKLDWLARLRDQGAQWLGADPQAQVALMGDWNIAPQDDDVWDMGFFEGKTHVSAPERAAFQAVVEAGFTDVVRPHAPGPGTFTYWDYTQLRFPKKQGMRIDFCLASPALASRVGGALIDREERKGKGASDHAPVIVDLD